MTTTTISSGTVTGLLVSANDVLDVVGSAVANGTTVDAYGTLNVSAGGVTSGSRLGDGTTGDASARETVSSGGTALGTVIDDGYLYATSGGTAVDTTLLAGIEEIEPGAVLSGATVSGGAVYLVGAGIGIVLDGGLDFVDGGTESGTVVNAGLDEVQSGTSTDTVVNSGGTQTLLSGYASTTTSHTSVNSGGLQDVEGGTAVDTVVRGGGSELIGVYGTATGLTVEAGGSVTIAPAQVYSGYTPQFGIVADIQLDAGATLTNGGEALFTTAGSLVEGGAISGSGSVTLQGPGTITLDGQDTYAGGTVIRAGTLSLGNAGAAGTGTITFAGQARLQISGTVMPTNVIAGAVPGDTVDLASVAYQADDTVTVAGNAVTLHSFAGSTETDYVLDVAGASTAGSITLSADATGDVLLGLPCYVTGTHILTARGEIPVEALRVGDKAVAMLGEPLARVRWIGHRTLDPRRHPTPSAVQPVRIRAGAFGPARPARDLCVSPGHALYVDGVLIQAERLVNGVSVVQEASARVTYWHVELERHSVLLAEGLPAESYLDIGNRAAFANGGAFLQLHPDFEPRHTAETCAPLVREGAVLEAVKARLLERVGMVFGGTTTQDPALHLLVDGVAMPPSATRDGHYRFQIPSAAHDLRLASRMWVPAQMLSASTDTRRLGVCVRSLAMNGQALDLSDARLISGWDKPERDTVGEQRWTQGCALLPGKATTAEVWIDGFATYWTTSNVGKGIAQAV